MDTWTPPPATASWRIHRMGYVVPLFPPRCITVCVRITFRECHCVASWWMVYLIDGDNNAEDGVVL